jgi:hypothetical protein
MEVPLDACPELVRAVFRRDLFRAQAAVSKDGERWVSGVVSSSLLIEK